MVEKKTDKPDKRGKPKKDKKDKKKKPVKKPIKKPVKPMLQQTQKQVVIVNVPERKRRAPRREVKPAVPTTVFRTIRQEVLPASHLLPQQDFMKPREPNNIGVRIPNDIRGTLQGEERELVKIPEGEAERALPIGEARPYIPGGRPRMDLTEEERRERKRQQKRESAKRARERKKREKELEESGGLKDV
jgi:hypothetical protein